MRTLTLLVIVGTLALPTATAMAEKPQQYDFVIYGPTSAGVAAAVQVKKMGKSVVVVGPDKHLGGLTAGGLGWTDSGNKAVIGGISREFYQRVKKYYDDPATWKWQDSKQYSRYRSDDDAQWTFEPHIAERVFEDIVREYEIPVLRDEWLDRGDGVAMKDNRIQSVTMLSGKTFTGSIFIDATYEGDLMAAAGVSFHVGREPNSQYNETLNGVQIANARSHQFTHNIRPYKTPGDPSSGLLPRVSAEPPGKQGEGDHRVQAYNFRMCLTRVPENRVPFPKPDGYDANQYELLLRTLLAGSRHITGKFDMLPNGKTDTNNHGSFSTDNIGMNYDYPEASYERRQEIIDEHRTYQQGYCYFLANDPRVPEDVRQWYGEWGLAKDEFTDHGHWPHQIYVREARRMVGDLVVNENHLRRKTPTARSIGMGSYQMDSHHTQRYVTAEGFVRNEGDVQINPGGPYPIDYGAIVPKQDECENLLVVCAVSSSHIAYGSIRMEPVFMILGQSGATAGVMALNEKIAVQDVDYEELRARLEEDGQVLYYSSGSKPAASLDLSKLPGVALDDTQAEHRGTWIPSQSIGPFAASGYLHDGGTRDGKSSIVYTANLPTAGEYEVRVLYSTNPNRATNTLITIAHAAGDTTVKVNQQTKPNSKDGFDSLGVFKFAADRPAVVTISNEGADGYVIADAVQLLTK